MTRFSSFRHCLVGRKMAEELFVATRKGLFLVEGGGRQAPRNLGFLGDPVSAFLADRPHGTLYAALNLGPFGVTLHRTEDFTASRTALPAPALQVRRAPTTRCRTEPEYSLSVTLAPGG